MATIREIKRRIRSVRNIGQVTRAMEAVAASKMRRAQEATLASREYAQKANEVLTYLASQPKRGPVPSPLLVQREVKTIGLLLITPDRGLAGPLVSNILRTALDFIKQQDVPVLVIAIGRKGASFMARHNYRMHAVFTGIRDLPSTTELSPIARLVIDDYTNGVFDKVYLGYTDFINTLIQRPVIRPLLPVEPALPEKRLPTVYTFEPDPQTILNEFVPRFTLLQIYQAILEAQASEHSARMVAMRNATENAEELVQDLTLTYNKARQTAITLEILDIAGGAEALARAQAELA
ncbi:MAG: ATP synthase F1 subunit gamma [Chloroflexi bacterium]|nr:MAG: ATP synthase F1 subunit gamma [Chloroflexota bacterium]